MYSLTAPPYALTQTVAPAEEPVTQDEAALYCRVEAAADFPLLLSLIKTARQACERVTRRSLVTQTWTLTIDTFPGYQEGGGVGLGRDWGFWGRGGAIILPRAPVQSVTSVKYDDFQGVEQTVATSGYQVALLGEQPRLLPAWGTFWPVARPTAGAVRIVYVAGYGAASAVPEEFKTRIKDYVAYAFARRGEPDEDFQDRLFAGLSCGAY